MLHCLMIIIAVVVVVAAACDYIESSKNDDDVEGDGGMHLLHNFQFKLITLCISHMRCTPQECGCA